MICGEKERPKADGATPFFIFNFFGVKISMTNRPRSGHTYKILEKYTQKQDLLDFKIGSSIHSSINSENKRELSIIIENLEKNRGKTRKLR